MDYLPPFVTTQHVNAVNGWTFAGGQAHQLGLGVLPFTVTPSGAVSHKAREQMAMDCERPRTTK